MQDAVESGASCGDAKSACVSDPNTGIPDVTTDCSQVEISEGQKSCEAKLADLKGCVAKRIELVASIPCESTAEEVTSAWLPPECERLVAICPGMIDK